MLVTTPIFYVNAKPHLGHAYSMVLADAIARWRGPTSKLSTGTDEHGVKVWRAAEAAGVPVEEWCAQTSGGFRSLADSLCVRYKRFIRTTDGDHKETVGELWNRLVANGAIYKGHHSGWYSVREERFLTERELETGKQNNVHFVTEENYKFRLNRYIGKVVAWLEEVKPVLPESRLNDLLPYVKATADADGELSVSRQRDAMQWGIPVPGDHQQLIYVWLDALANYLTVNGGIGSPCGHKFTHILGMDILKFHAIYWPAFLIAADLAHLLPERLVVHGHWLMSGEKMSKSVGNVVDPVLVLGKYGGNEDILRWFMLRNTNLRSDQDFDEALMVRQYNQDLVNGLGNLWSRVNGTKLHVNIDNQDVNQQYTSDVISLVQRTAESFDKYDFQTGILGILEALGLCNRFVSESKPWAMQDASVVRNTVQRCLSAMVPVLQPIVPRTCMRLQESLNEYKGPLVMRL